MVAVVLLSRLELGKLTSVVDSNVVPLILSTGEVPVARAGCPRLSAVPIRQLASAPGLQPLVCLVV